MIPRGRGHGSLRKIHAAVKSCVTPSTAAASASQAFRWSVSLKKRRNQGPRVGAGIDDELARDDPDRLGDQKARDERDQELPGRPALRGCVATVAITGDSTPPCGSLQGLRIID